MDKCVQALIDAGANVNVKNGDGATPLSSIDEAPEALERVRILKRPVITSLLRATPC